MMKITLTDMNIALESPPWTLEPALKDFESDFQMPDIRCRVIFAHGRADIDPSSRILSTGAQSVYRSNGRFYFEFDDPSHIPSYISATEDWSECCIYVSEDYDKREDASCADRVRNGVFFGLKTIFVMSLLWRQGVFIHAASIDWNGKGILFSAPSGTGKSTHVHLWKKKYDVPILDGDTTACRIVNGCPAVYGLPWCGTSGEYINISLPLGAVVFLEQDNENSIVRLDPTEAAVRLYARSFLFTWDEKMADLALETVTQIVSAVRCYLLRCRPDDDAMELVRKCLEND